MEIEVARVASEGAGRALPCQAQLLTGGDAGRDADVDLLNFSIVGHGDFLLRTEHRFFQRYGQIVLQVLALLGYIRVSLAATKQIGKRVRFRASESPSPPGGGSIGPGTPPAKAPESETAKNFIQIDAPKNILLGVALAELVRAELVVLLLFLRVTEDGIGLTDLLELLFRGLVVGVPVRMVLQGQLPVSLLDLLRRGRFFDP